MAYIDLPDVNVWIALNAPNHPHAQRADYFWQFESYPEVVFNTVTMLGLVRTCSSAQLFDGKSITPLESWRIYQNWMQFEWVGFVPEMGLIQETLGNMMHSGIVTGRTVTDAYLAAFAIANDLRLVSFDSDFHRFKGLNFLHLI